jgi:hypothetical protein
MKFYLIIFITIFANISFAQNKIFYNKIYCKDIKTVRIFPEKSQFSYPIITLGSNEHLHLEFDDLESNNATYDYTYKIIHCNADWTQSDLAESDFIDGFNENNITNFSSSFNTLVDYVHYWVNFPNDNFNFKLSGNYVIMVYKNYNTDDTVLTMRFCVSENAANINAKILIPTINQYKKEYQEINLTVTSSLITGSDALRYLKVFVSQNNIPYKIKQFKPSYISQNKAVFNNPFDNIFLGGNEFHYFDCKSIRYAPEKVATIKLQKIYNFYLVPVIEKNQYFYTKDINGKYYIGNTLGNNPDNDADYVYVHFYFKQAYPFPQGDVYVIGEFNNWQFTNENKMTYNQKFKLYQCKILLKQGYYNYKFAFKNKTLNSIDGNYSETKNTYIIYVYFHDFNLNYDKLLAAKVVSN